MSLIWPEIENKDFMSTLLSPHLTVKEAITSQTAIRKNIDNTPTPEVLENLKYIAIRIFELVREHFGKPIHISSGYRSPALNKAVGGSKNSQHVVGQALDIQGTAGVTNAQIFGYIRHNLEFDQLIWEYGDTNEPAWVHVSLRKDGVNRKEVFAIGVNKKF